MSTKTAPDSKENTSRFEVEKVKPKDQPLTYRGVRSMKHKGDKHYQEGLRKSSSLHDLSTDDKEISSLESSRFLSRSGDRLDSTDGATLPDNARLLAGYTNPYATLPRNINWQAPSPAKPLQSLNKQDSSSASSVSSVTSQSGTSTSDSARRGSLDDKAVSNKPRNASERVRLHRERSASMKTFPSNFSLPKIPSSVGSSNADRLMNRPESTSSIQQGSGSVPSENETDEFKVSYESPLLHINSFCILGNYTPDIWASTRENLSSGVCEQHRSRPFTLAPPPPPHTLTGRVTLLLVLAF